MRWEAKTYAQWKALDSEARISLFGGAAGALKTFTLLADAIKEYRNPNFHGVIFRESYPQLALDVIRKSHSLYPLHPYYGDYNKTDKTWRFPSNAAEMSDDNNLIDIASGKLKPIYTDGHCARLLFRYMANDDDVYDYQGAEFSFIGFDESTHHTEWQIRYLLSRLRSTDPTLQLRMRLATNPGGPGHDFHLKLFLGGVCPHCQPNSPKAKEPYEIYDDGCWSDGTPLSQMGDDGQMQYVTTQFIPGNVSDHELFGKGNESYKANLRLQRPATAKALLAGCWSIFEGQYFTCWDEARGTVRNEDGTVTIPKPDMRMVISRKELDIPYWYPHFTGTDYGFTISSAASYLFVRYPRDEWFPNGRIYVIDEVMRAGVIAEDLADLLMKRWFLNEVYPGQWTVPEQPRNIQLWALSPDAWIKTGMRGRHGEEEHDVQLSRADQMNAKLFPYRMAFSMANNDRQGGWQHVYRMLRSGELVICGDTCPNLLAAIPSRIHEPDKEDDILKVKGDPLDDCMDAFRYGIYTWTREPSKPIEIARAEAMQGLDPTNAMITKHKFDSQNKKTSGPIFYGPGAARRQAMYKASLKRRPR